MISVNRKSGVSTKSSMNRRCFSELPSAGHVIHRAISALDDETRLCLTNGPSMNRMHIDINRACARVKMNRLSLWWVLQVLVIQRGNCAACYPRNAKTRTQHHYKHQPFSYPVLQIVDLSDSNNSKLVVGLVIAETAYDMKMWPRRI
jgi:hypothetical protein